MRTYLVVRWENNDAAFAKIVMGSNKGEEWRLTSWLDYLVLTLAMHFRNFIMAGELDELRVGRNNTCIQTLCSGCVYVCVFLFIRDCLLKHSKVGAPSAIIPRIRERVCTFLWCDKMWGTWVHLMSNLCSLKRGKIWLDTNFSLSSNRVQCIDQFQVLLVLLKFCCM